MKSNKMSISSSFYLVLIKELLLFIYFSYIYNEIMLKGIGIACGIEIGKAYKYAQPILTVKEEKGNPEKELIAFDKALDKTTQDILDIKNRANSSLCDDELAIFDAHLSMAKDPEFIGQVKDMINLGFNAAFSIKAVTNTMIDMFKDVEDIALKERAKDIEDFSYRLLCNLLNKEIPNLSSLSEKVIVVAKDLSPADTACLNREYVLGFLTEDGSLSSHTAIMAESLDIPAIVSVNDLMNTINNGDTIIIDSLNGDVIVNPSQEDIHNYTIKKENYLAGKEALKSLKDKETITLDKRKIELSANIGTLNDLKGAIENGAEGIGLLRTEFLYMNKTNSFPSEEEQFVIYKEILEKMNGKRVVIRTLDIGGDKELKYCKFDKEENPFLGYRAIRFSLDRKDIFKDQVRAMLRASVYGKLAIMFPMISTLEEFLEAKSFVLKQKEQLLNEGVEVSEDIEIGMMVEVPAAAILADEFSKYADFFSIGTNDLIQYSLAVDRMSKKVSYLYQPLNPSILRLIKATIDGAHKNGKWCGMCGELAGDELATEVLVGLGIDELSMSSSKILPVRKKITWLSFNSAQEKAKSILLLEKPLDIEELLKRKD